MQVVSQYILDDREIDILVAVYQDDGGIRPPGPGPRRAPRRSTRPVRAARRARGWPSARPSAGRRPRARRHRGWPGSPAEACARRSVLRAMSPRMASGCARRRSSSMWVTIRASFFSMRSRSVIALESQRQPAQPRDSDGGREVDRSTRCAPGPRSESALSGRGPGVARRAGHGPRDRQARHSG